MLSSLSSSLLPASVAGLFEPPLDEQQLKVSLTSGAINIQDAQLSPQRVNELILPAPGSAIRLLRGSVASLELSVNWRQLLTRPLMLKLRGLHLTFTHAESHKHPATVKSQPNMTDEGDMTREMGVEAAGAAAAGGWTDEQLMEECYARKQTILEAAVPIGPSLTDKIKQAAMQTGGGSGWLSGLLKQLVSFALNSLQLQVTGVSVEFVAQQGGFTDDKKQDASAWLHGASSSVSGSSSAPPRYIRLGVELSQCALLESVKREEANDKVTHKTSKHVSKL